MNRPNLPVRKRKCATCPFRAGGHTELAPYLAESALNDASRICHSTGKNNAFHDDTGRPEALCRGAHDVQLEFFAGLGFIDAATDEAWNAKRAEMGMSPQRLIGSSDR